MGLWEAVALVGTMATILGVFITIYGLINNRMLKQEAKNTQDLIEREVTRTQELMESGAKRTQEIIQEQARSTDAQAKSTRELIQEENRANREILLRIEQGQNEARREMAEAIKYVADLVRLEGEKTREVVRAKP